MTEHSDNFNLPRGKLTDSFAAVVSPDDESKPGTKVAIQPDKLLTDMLAQERIQIDFRTVAAAIEAKLAARDAQEDHEQRNLAQKIVSGVGPFIINEHQEKTHGWE